MALVHGASNTICDLSGRDQLYESSIYFASFGPVSLLNNIWFSSDSRDIQISHYTT